MSVVRFPRNAKPPALIEVIPCRAKWTTVLLAKKSNG